MPAYNTTATAEIPSLFSGHYAYARDGLNLLHALNRREQASPRCEDARQTLAFQPNADLSALLERELAPEMWPRDNVFALSADKAVVDAAIHHARDTQEWPAIHYLWPLHPILQWLDYKMLALFGRQKAPVIRAPRGLAAGEAIVLLCGQIPNRRGQSVLAEWLGVRVDSEGRPQAPLTLPETLELTGLGQAELVNDGKPLAAPELARLLEPALAEAERVLRAKKQTFDACFGLSLKQELERLRALRDRHAAQIELDFAQTPDALAQGRKKRREAETDDLFEQYRQWARQTLELDDRAQFTVLALLVAGEVGK